MNMNRSEANSDPRAEGGGSGQSPAKAAMARVRALADAQRRNEFDDTPEPSAPRRSSQTPQQERLADAMDGGVDLGGTNASPGRFQDSGVVQRAISGLTRSDGRTQPFTNLPNSEEEKISQEEAPVRSAQAQAQATIGNGPRAGSSSSTIPTSMDDHDMNLGAPSPRHSVS